MKSVVALLTAAALAIAPAKAAEQKQPPLCAKEASMVIDAIVIWYVIVSATYIASDLYIAWSKYQRARGKHGPDVELTPKCEWVPAEKKS